MKKIATLVLGLFFIGYSMEAQINVTWGNRFYDLTDFTKDARIVGEDWEGYYMWYSMEEYLGNGQYGNNYYLARFGHDNRIKKIVKLDFKDAHLKISHVWRSGENIGFILSKTVKKTKSTTLYKQFFQTKDMRLMGTPEPFHTFVQDTKNAGKPYLFALSENGSKVGFCFAETQDSASNLSMTMKIYDERLRLLWERTYAPTFTNPTYAYETMAISNDGQKMVIGVKTVQSGKKVDHTTGVLDIFWFTEYKGRKHQLKLEKAWAQSFQTAFNMENDYVIAGYYGNNALNPSESKGVFSYLFDDRRGEMKQQGIQLFKNDTPSDTEQPKDMLPKEAMQCHADYLIPMMSGNVILIGEERADFIPKPARRNQKQEVTFAQGMHYRNLHITSINKKGIIVSDNFVPKRQVNAKGDNSYNSYALVSDRFHVFLVFNDHISNFTAQGYHPIRNYNSDKMRTFVSMVKIFPDGSFRWHEVNKTNTMKMPFYKTIYLDTEKRLIFFSRYEDNNILGSFPTE